MFGRFYEKLKERMAAYEKRKNKQRRNHIELQVGQVMFDPAEFDIWTASREDDDVEHMTGIMYIADDPVFLGWGSSRRKRKDMDMLYPLEPVDYYTYCYRSSDRALFAYESNDDGEITWVAKVIGIMGATLVEHAAGSAQWWLVIQPVADKRMARTFDFRDERLYTRIMVSDILNLDLSLEYDEDVQSRARRVYLTE